VRVREDLMRLLFAILLATGCTGSELPTLLEGPHGFEVRAAVALQCPPDIQGQFMKVFIEGTSPASECDMEFPRAIPVTCEERRTYLEQMHPVCLGALAAPGEHLPMLDYLLELEEGSWVDFDYVPMITCVDGEEELVELWGNTEVILLEDDRLLLDFDLGDESGELSLLSGSVEVEICDAE
jgi:hypothetical protein